MDNNIPFWILQLEKLILIQKTNIEKLMKENELRIVEIESAEFCHIFFFICFGLQKQLPPALLPKVEQISIFRETIEATQKKLAVFAGTVMLSSGVTKEDVLRDILESFKYALIKIFPSYIILNDSSKVNITNNDSTHQQVIDKLLEYLLGKSNDFGTNIQNEKPHSEFCQVIMLTALDLEKSLPQNYQALISSLNSIMKHEINYAKGKFFEVGGSLIRLGYSGDEIIDYMLNLMRNSLVKKFPNGTLFPILNNHN